MDRNGSTYHGNQRKPQLSGCLALPAKALTVALTPIQDLHGYDHPWEGGAGKNKLPMTIAGIKAANTGGTWNGNVYSINNVTVTILTDTDDNVVGFKFNGTPNATITFIIANTAYIDYSVLSGKNCYLSGCPSGGDDSVYKLQYWSANYQRVDIGSGVAVSFPSSAPTSCNFAILLYSGVQANNLIFYPQCEIGDSATTFAPWENICPISGRVSTSVSTTDGTDTESVFITFSTTVYGCTVNFITGELTITHVIADLGTNQSDWYMASTDTSGKQRLAVQISDIKTRCALLCNVFADVTGSETYQCVEGVGTDNNLRITLYKDDLQTLDAWKAWATDNNLQVCYELATPTTLQLTPDELIMLKGNNSVSGDGVITITALTGDPWS